ncbi:MAG: Polyketide cyclase, partial [Pseudonocardia sp.]|nr:Polyketide cyclase [Pseudonocardia sp.]
MNVTVDVDAPPEQVWRAAMDWERQGEWILATQVRVVDGDGESVGSKVEAVTGIGGLGVSDTFEIVEWEPPQRCVVRHTGRVVRGTGTFEVRPRGTSASTFVWTEHLDLPLGRLGALC